MELIVISGAIALLVSGLEGLRQRHSLGAALRAILVSPQVRQATGMGLLVAIVLALGQWGISFDSPPWPYLLLGAFWGMGAIWLSPLGRVAQALAVIVACLWTLALPPEDSILGSLAALGLGLALTGVPAWMVMSASARVPLANGLAQGWVLIAASTWGIRLAELVQGEAGWFRVLPCGLGALALVGGTVQLLVERPDGVESGSGPDLQQGESGWMRWLGRFVGGTVASLLSVVLIRNWLYQGLFYPSAFGIGVAISLLLLALEERQIRTLSQGKEVASAQLLQQGILGLALVGGGALLALRLGGSYGAAVIGLGVLTFSSSWGATAALFLGARPLVQSLLYEFDLNLSGINITHSYTYAALFLGIAGILIALTVRELYGGRFPTLVALGLTTGSVALTGLTGYFIHLQPQAAMVLGALMVALVIAALEPALSSALSNSLATPAGERSSVSPGRISRGWGTQGLLLALIAILTALVGTDLTAAGTEATRWERVWVFAGMVGAGVLIGGIGSWVVRRSTPRLDQ